MIFAEFLIKSLLLESGALLRQCVVPDLLQRPRHHRFLDQFLVNLHIILFFNIALRHLMLVLKTLLALHRRIVLPLLLVGF